ncbi:PREDICTED: potassium transporter 5-like isoform X2 [Lupinus angustifolius]|uniref:potassium transporter 5-like isoform X2 n=1 Tax=Lupinus angustifolius TaxID=3871 RepID=UPI00092E4F9B|nr:PREDICTED: potassium transporter 5-like isoform X2 [Lupinus angustifolius]
MPEEADNQINLEEEIDTTNNAKKDNLKLKDRKISWAKLRRVDSLNLEAGRVSMTGHNSKMGLLTTLSFAFQSIGIVYGDIGTSPLYVYASTFTDGIKNKDDILGVLSLIIYTIVLIPMLKYVFIVLWANDNGNGGAFALYSLICRHVKMSLIPNQQPEDKELSNYKLETPSSQMKRAQKIKHKLEGSHYARIILLLVTIMGTSMVIGDGILTPTISVLSAVSGISTSLGQDVVVGITIAILIVLFAGQRFGTDKVGFTFAPIIFIWFSFIAGIGLYNLFKYDIGVLLAFNPKYIVDYFKRNGKDGWISLGGVFLCITGSEAMFADLGHFNVRSIQLSFSFITFPSILAAYIGQAAYLRKFPENVANTFYDSIPRPIYWPTFVVAVGASIIASQAMISGAFSIISQALSLGCFPTIKVVHTSHKHHGQVYIPEINYMFMIACIVVCAAFKTTEKISHAYGIAVVGDMFITTSLVSLIMLVIWKKSIWQVALFYIIFGFTELLYFSAQLTKFTGGGYLPLVSAFFLTLVMGIWHYVYKEKYLFELKNKVSTEYLREIASNPNISRVPGIGFLYTDLVQGIPPIFQHFIDSVPSIHSVIVFVSIKAIPVSRVAIEERYLFRQVDPKEYRMFRCVVRHGYNDVLEDPVEFELQLVQHLKGFIQEESLILEVDQVATNEQVPSENEMEDNVAASVKEGNSTRTNSSSNRIIPSQVLSRPSSDSIQSLGLSATKLALSSPPILGAEEEVKFIEKEMEKSVVHMLAEAEVVAHPNSSFLNKIVVNYAYSFLRKNFRQREQLMAIPRKKLLKVGMTYEI